MRNSLKLYKMIQIAFVIQTQSLNDTLQNVFFQQGMVLPAVQSTMSKWTPTLERSKLVGFVLAGK